MFIQAIDNIIGDVVLLIGHKDIVTCLGKNKIILFVLVVGLEEILKGVTESLVELGRLVGQFILQLADRKSVV